MDQLSILPLLLVSTSRWLVRARVRCSDLMKTPLYLPTSPLIPTLTHGSKVLLSQKATNLTPPTILLIISICLFDLNSMVTVHSTLGFTKVFLKPGH